ncbi:hypothetical protein B0G76_2185 [Paraburkholderia sp. BL23I1N1]|uniref:hypothetical protein n=1 Tax=Paraburkholderia sp. BL23I1N1 TaxID=1938802 RepID=UPI000E754BF5|nr:hypothetical protein [Paraburkholderia sp. BL23I1N1]RKE36039.1 hypothetical protein B0G76_2185 [Paraburkholderia sp. BL23I1N1]
MNAQEFDELFEEIVVTRLENEGFSREGKSLYMVDGACQFGWIRGGGRLSKAGTLAHVVVFRHSFLRGKSVALHTDAPHATGDYPWILSGEDLVGSTPIDWCFEPSRLMTPPYGWLNYETLSADQVAASLDARRVALLDYVAWARSLSLSEAHVQVARHANDYWIAGLWDEDYRAILKR